MKRTLLALALISLASPAWARVDADPSQAYTVAPTDGDWMILVTDFRGETALQQAHNLVLEIRTKYDLKAFVYDRTGEERRKQQVEIDQQRQQIRQYLEAQGVRPEDVHVPVRTTRIEPGCAVLVGSWRDMDAARKALDDLRKLKPPESMPRPRWDVGDPAGPNAPAAAQRETNPFATSFVVHNPTVPVTRVVDDEDTAKALRYLNSEESYSVYKCRKPWTLAIASYQGMSSVASKSASPSLLQKLFGSAPDNMGAAAMNAHNLAEALHKMGYNAYVFHTRYRSVVTVDGFDSESDQRMKDLHQALMTRIKKDPKVALPMFDTVVPMAVPR
jgi:hypothetical protein